MKVFASLTPLAPPAAAVALGYFDGVHLGHRAVLGAASRYAQSHGLAAAAFTFTLPGSQTLKGGRILSDTQKHDRMAKTGITRVLEPPFTAFCTLTPAGFVDEILVGCLGAKAVFCGDNFTFGARAAGNTALLAELCAGRGIQVEIVEMAQYCGAAVSSTRIRAALEEGRLEDANAMLGAPYAIDWPVTHGQGIGASRLGTPTVNQNYPDGALRPCPGVYLTRIKVGERWYPAATGIGPRPTVTAGQAHPQVTCESYLPDFSGDLYGQTPTLEFHRYLGPPRRFDSLEELSALIRDAAEQSKAYFAKKSLAFAATL